MNKKNIYALSLLVGSVLPVNAQSDSIASGSSFALQKIEVGANKDFVRSQSTAAVTVIENKDVNKRSAKNIGNSIIGQGGNGLVSLQGAGTYYSANPTFYIRGLQSLSSNASGRRYTSMKQSAKAICGLRKKLTNVSPTSLKMVAVFEGGVI